jgi:hypothetical protein
MTFSLWLTGYLFALGFFYKDIEKKKIDCFFLFISWLCHFGKYFRWRMDKSKESTEYDPSI